MNQKKQTRFEELKNMYEKNTTYTNDILNFEWVTTRTDEI